MWSRARRPAIVERIKIHGTALEGNLEGDAVDRDAIVFLPPSYNQNRTRRYPVVYALHGYSIGAEQWTQEIHVPQTIEGAFAKGAREMIVVLPDSKTVHNGSMYSSSVTTGDFENYVARDVVSYIDAHYRTIPKRDEPRPRRPLHGRLRRHAHRHEARGRVRQPVHHEPVLPVAAWQRRPRRSAATPANDEALAAVKTAADSAKLPFGLRAQLASAAAWSPNPKNPPLYLDLPIGDQRAGGAGEMGGQRAAGVHRSVRRRTCAGIARSRSTSATRTACASTPGSCTTCSISTASRTRSRSTPARTPATSPFASRST